MTRVTHYSNSPDQWLFGFAAGGLSLYSTAKTLRIARIIYPIFAQMRQAIGTPRYSALQMQWNAVSWTRFRGTLYAITALVSGAIACTIFFRCIKALSQSQQQRLGSPALKRREYPRY